MPSRIKWTLEKIKAGLERYKHAHQRYPTASEIDAEPYLPSSRQIQRQFGGLPALRQKLGLSGQTDFTKGKHSSERARMIGQRAHKLENEVYEYLVRRFGKIAVHREYLFSDDGRNRSDFFVYCAGEPFSVDVFFPKDRHNLLGCLNSKMKSYGRTRNLQYPVIFLMMNEQISEEEIESVVANKKNKLRPGERVLNFQAFKRFCATKEKLA